MKIGSVKYNPDNGLAVDFLPENVNEGGLLGAAAGILDFHGEDPKAAVPLLKAVAAALGIDFTAVLS